MVDERVMQIVVLVAEFQDGSLEGGAFGNAHAQAEVTGGHVADDDFQRNDLNLLHKGVAVVDLFHIVGGNAFFFQLLHQRVGQFVVDDALVADGALLFAVAGGGIVLIVDHDDFRIAGSENLLCLAFVHLFFNFVFHDKRSLYVMYKNGDKTQFHCTPFCGSVQEIVYIAAASAAMAASFLAMAAAVSARN